MANGPPTILPNKSPKHKLSTSDKTFVLDDDNINNVTISPLYDLFDHQLQYSIPSHVPSCPFEPYSYHADPGISGYPIKPIQDNARKRQRRQTAGNLLVNTLFNRAANNNTTTPNANAAAIGSKLPKKKQSTAQPRPHIAVPPNGIGPILDPNVNDVLSGRGGRINAHVGNVQFREIVAERKKDYLAKETKKLEKAHIAADIVYYVRRMDPPGRFLKEDINGAWWDIGDQKAIKKVGQALREDAPDIRDPDELNEANIESQTSPKLSTHSSSVGKPAIIPTSSSTESTPTQVSRPVALASEPTTSIVPIPPLTTSGSAGSTSGKPATAVSSRGGKLTHTSSSSSSVRSQSHGIGGSYPLQPASFQIDIRPPDLYQTVIPQQPPQRSGSGNVPFYGNIGFRSGAQRIGAAVSGAAAAVMKQQQQQSPMHEFEVPAARTSAQEAFGRTFHAPPDAQHGESSLISGFSGGASAVSGMSGISALTDPMSSISNSDVYNSEQSKAIRQAQLDRTRQNWSSPSAITNSDNTHTISLLRASNGIGSSLNNSVAMRSRIDNVDDGMSWTHSLHGGDIGSIREDTVPDESVLFGGTESQLSAGSVGNYSFGAFSANSGTGLAGASKHSLIPGIHSKNTRNNVGVTPAYYPGDASVNSVGMSIASAGVDSLPSMSELSENFVALDLANNISGYHQEEI